MTRADKLARREAIAADAAAGMLAKDIAAKHGVALTLVWWACSDQKVTLRKTGAKTLPRTYRILRDLWDGMTAAQVALKNGASIASVCYIRNRAVENGWPELKKVK